MAEHTKEKWIYQRSMGAAKSNYDILESGGFEILASLGLSTETNERDLTNARRIAATPDLLAACKMIRI